MIASYSTAVLFAKTFNICLKDEIIGILSVMTDKNTVFQHNNMFPGSNASGGFEQKKMINARGKLIDLSSPKVMGILNLTPDSFYDKGRNFSLEFAIDRTEQMLIEGADFIDIGAYSSRPRAEHISQEEELNRLLPVLKTLVKEFPEATISIDTFRAAVAEAAINEGAHIINDISGGELDQQMFETVSRLQVPYILMHMRGTPQNMQDNIQYEDVFQEVFQYFANKVSNLRAMGVKDIIIDPGFGFAKKIEHSYGLLSKLEDFKLLQLPVLAGVSRKSMIHKPLGITADEALNGTTVANTIALMKGANILRVHDVKAAAEAVKIFGMLNQ
jgi:dihydropteroate synthase